MADAQISKADWEEAGLGPENAWPRLLESTADLVINTKVPMMIVWGPELILYFNGAFTEILGAGWPRVLGARMPEVWAQAWPQIKGFVEEARTGKAVLIEDFAVPTQRSGFEDVGYFTFSYTPMIDGKAVVGLLCVCTETTHTVLADRKLKRLQSELIHLSRVSAMEAMASSIAHEINQPLAAIAGFVWGAERLLESDKPTREEELKGALRSASEAVMRAGNVIRRTRDMLQGRDTNTQSVDASYMVTESKALGLDSDKHLGIDVKTDLAPDLYVEADRVQIQQVLLNLIRNAVEAMEDADNKELEIATRREDDTAVFSVADRGPGLSEEARNSLFQPFASTKEQGLGVGLSISRTIVEAHGGRLWVEDRPSGGTRFSFSLRLSDEGPQPSSG